VNSSFSSFDARLEGVTEEHNPDERVAITLLRRKQTEPKAPEDAGMAPAGHAKAVILISGESLRKRDGIDFPGMAMAGARVARDMLKRDGGNRNRSNCP
jgi:hypothetical protein